MLILVAFSFFFFNSFKNYNSLLQQWGTVNIRDDNKE